MEVKNSDMSHSKSGKEYERALYHCLTDDIWVNVEIPKE
jgi:hypothetical protein